MVCVALRHGDFSIIAGVRHSRSLPQKELQPSYAALLVFATLERGDV